MIAEENPRMRAAALTGRLARAVQRIVPASGALHRNLVKSQLGPR
jgi:hypothetical protein